MVLAAICCSTFRRPEGLRRLLWGLNAQEFIKSPAPRILVVVIDNDATASVRTLVDTVRPSFRWELLYRCEPKQGLSNARNRALDLVAPEADYIAFIDDDEVPARGWLDELLYVRRVYGASIVQGPVVPVFCSAKPRWIVGGKFFEQGPYRDGSGLPWAATNNSLIDGAVVRRLGLRFDERFNQTGGEDQQFFGCAIERGERVITAEKALVYEWIPASRTKLSYILRRKFRIGTTLAMSDRIRGGNKRLALRAVKGVWRIGVGIVQTAWAVRGGYAAGVAALCNIAWGIGTLASLLGITYNEYDPVRVGSAERSQHQKTLR